MTSIQGVSSLPATNTSTVSATPSAGSALGSLNSSEFLQLLVTQLTHQDPTNPMDPTQMISQTSTLTMVQDLQNLTTSMQQLQANVANQEAQGLISRAITYQDSSGATNSGTVSSVSFSSSGPTLSVNGSQVPLSSVTSVTS